MASEGWGKQGSWEETESFVGKTIAISKGVDAVELGSVRKWLEPKHFFPPIHSDTAAAKAAGYRDVVAPRTMAVTLFLCLTYSLQNPSHAHMRCLMREFLVVRRLIQHMDEVHTRSHVGVSGDHFF